MHVYIKSEASVETNANNYLLLTVAQPGFLQGGGAKFFGQHSPGAMVSPSGSSHNRDIEAFFPRK